MKTNERIEFQNLLFKCQRTQEAILELKVFLSNRTGLFVEQCMSITCQLGVSQALESFVKTGKASWDQLLLVASESGGTEEILRFLISKGAYVNTSDSDGNSPLHFAAKVSLTLVKQLIDNGANVNRQNKEGKTPLYLAVEQGYLKIVEFLIQKGAKVNRSDSVEAHKNSPLHLTVEDENYEIAKVLITNGAKSKPNSEKDTPLHLAAKKGLSAFVGLLIQKGHNVETENNLHETPLKLAIQKQYTDITKMLIANSADISSLEGYTPLQLAIKKERCDTVKLLIDNGAKVCEKDKHLLSEALFRYIQDLPTSKIKIETGVVECLIVNGADVNYAAEGASLLRTSMIAGHSAQLIKVLLENGAKVSEEDKPLLSKALFKYIEKNIGNSINIGTIESLIIHGADVSTGEDSSLLESVLNVRNVQLTKILIENGATITLDQVRLVDSYGYLGSILRVLISIKDKKNNEYKFKVNGIINENGDRFIDLMAENVSKNYSSIKLLREHGSVEPKEPITSKNIVGKLEVSWDEAPDSIPSNLKKAEALLVLMDSRYPLTEDQIDKNIAGLKQKIKGIDNANECIKLGSQKVRWDGIKTIEGVIDTLASMTEVEDRLDEPWSFRKVLGILIEMSNTDEEMTIKLIDTLSQIQACALSKLIHLLYVCQDRLLVTETDYTKMDLGDFAGIYTKIFNEVIKVYGDNAPLVVIDWLNDIHYIKGKDKDSLPPEQWCSSTQDIQGIFNTCFMQSWLSVGFESYHFEDGLKLKIIKPLIELIEYSFITTKVEAPSEEIKYWQDLVIEGASQLVKRFVEKVVSNKIALSSDQNMLYGLIDHELAFGYFKMSLDDVVHFCREISTGKENGERGISFLQLIREAETLDEYVRERIDILLALNELFYGVTKQSLPGNWLAEFLSYFFKLNGAGVQSDNVEVMQCLKVNTEQISATDDQRSQTQNNFAHQVLYEAPASNPLTANNHNEVENDHNEVGITGNVLST